MYIFPGREKFLQVSYLSNYQKRQPRVHGSPWRFSRRPRLQTAMWVFWKLLRCVYKNSRLENCCIWSLFLKMRFSVRKIGWVDGAVDLWGQIKLEMTFFSNSLFGRLCNEYTEDPGGGREDEQIVEFVQTNIYHGKTIVTLGERFLMQPPYPLICRP